MRLYCTLLIICLSAKSFGQSPFMLITDSINVTDEDEKISSKSQEFLKNETRTNRKEAVRQVTFLLKPLIVLANPEAKLMTSYQVAIIPVNGTTEKLTSRWIQYETSSASITLTASLNGLKMEPGHYRAQWKIKTNDSIYYVKGEGIFIIKKSTNLKEKTEVERFGLKDSSSQNSRYKDSSQIPYRDAPTSLASSGAGRGKNIHHNTFKKWFKSLFSSTKRKGHSKEKCPSL